MGHLAGSVSEHVTLDLGAVSSSPIIGHRGYFKNTIGAPGWLSQLSVWLRLRSRSCGLWVRAPHWTLCWRLRAWSLLQILCLPRSLLLPHSYSVSLSLWKINIKKKFKIKEVSFSFFQPTVHSLDVTPVNSISFILLDIFYEYTDIYAIYTCLLYIYTNAGMLCLSIIYLSNISWRIFNISASISQSF